ncbi:hypothetical protein FD31_GL000831 [Companilactobacillus nantensis DSM 16982]|uniref:Uncharacterized protein n=1 Tax=Companilactobacillus nantensis DSM 16982 TaxID=1423774 RepID=A0A0R1WNQ2_9LACO|nr:hypothetical protein FD31_GL000831 [Companilactobacillus nantensis DSM 16982]
MILEKNDSGRWEPARDKHASTFEQTKAFTDINVAKRSMSGIKSYWHGEYKIVSYAEEN